MHRQTCRQERCFQGQVLCSIAWEAASQAILHLPTRIPNPSPAAFAAKPGRRDETDRAR